MDKKKFREARFHMLWQMVSLVSILGSISLGTWELFTGVFLPADLQIFLRPFFSVILFLDLAVKRRLYLWIRETSATTGHYLIRSRLSVVVDLLSFLPFGLFSYLFDMPFLICGVFIRIFKIFDIFKILPGFELLSSLTRIFKLLTTILFAGIFVHTIASLWLVFTYDSSIIPGENFINSVYWVITTLTTVGYGDITPTTTAARLFTMLVMILGVAFYGLIIGFISRSIAMIDQYKAEEREKIDSLIGFMKHYKIPIAIQQQVHSYYRHRLKKKFSLGDQGAISDLPKSLQKELEVYLRIELIREISIFSECSENCLKELAKSLDKKFFTPGSIIIKKGEVGDELFVIDHGFVEILGDDGSVVATLSEEECFGELALLEKKVRIATVKAATYCDLYILKSHNFESITSRYPDFKNHLKKIRDYHHSKNKDL